MDRYILQLCMRAYDAIGTHTWRIEFASWEAFGKIIWNRVALCLMALIFGCSGVDASEQKNHAKCSESANTCEMRNIPNSFEAAKQAPFETNATAMEAVTEATQLDSAYRALFADGDRDVFSSAGRQLHFEGGTVIWLGELAVLLAPATDSAASALATGTLGVFYLKYVGQKFEVVREFPFAIDGSIGGNPPKWEISRDISDLPVVVSTSSGVWQGVYCATTLLTEIGPEAPTDMISFRSAFDNSGSGQTGDHIQSINGKITKVKKNNSFDVEFAGTRSFTHSYEKHSGTYELKSGGGTENLPKC